MLNIPRSDVTQEADSVSMCSSAGPPNYAAFGPRIRAERQRQSQSLRDLTGDVGVSASLVSQIENTQAIPSVNTLYALVTTFRMSMDEVSSVGLGASTGYPSAVAAHPRWKRASSDL
jgi:transcriptional regulator with XRE-family HTH domain